MTLQSLRRKPHSGKRGLTAIVALFFAFGLIGAVSVPASATESSVPMAAKVVSMGLKTTDATPPPGMCLKDTIQHKEEAEVSHQEYRYRQVTPGQHHDATSHEEWRFRTRTVTYGEVEHKYVYSTYNFVDGGTTTVNGHTVSGHWVGGYSSAWRAIPDSIINAVWGSSGIPSNLIGGSEANPKGNVNLNVYGGPNVSVSYYAATESNPSGYTDWGPWSAWSTTNPGADTNTLDAESRTVSDNNAYDDPPVTTYYVAGGSPSSNESDASWVLADPDGDGPWTKFDERKVVDTEAKEAWTEYIYGPCHLACEGSFTQYVTHDNYSSLGWSTEDGMPTFTSSGLHFVTPTVSDRQNFFNGVFETPVSGLTNFAYTVKGKDGVTAQTALKFEGWTTGTGGYATWSFEPYMNGMPTGDGTFHTFMITDDSLIWSSKIASPNPGSQSNPQTVGWFKTTYPNALMRVGLGQGSYNAGADSYVSYVGWQDGDGNCGSATFGLSDTPNPGAYDDYVWDGNPVCLWEGGGTEQGVHNFYEQEDATWNEEAQSWVPGEYVLVKSEPVERPIADDEDGPCPPPTVVPGNPQIEVTKVCGMVTMVFSNDVTLGEHEIGTPETFVYSDNKGVLQEVTIEPNGEPVTVTVKFDEDTGNHNVQYGVKGEKLETIIIGSDCLKPPPDKDLAGTGFNAIMWLTLAFALVYGGYRLLKWSRRDRTIGASIA